MPVRKQSPYGPFIEYVVLPAIRIGTLLLAVLTIVFASWLEANDDMENCSFKSSLSLHQVFLFRNITNNMTMPDSVSFGLWKHCYIYSHNCSCSPTNLRYQPDISTILQVATSHNAIESVSTVDSLVRIVPLTLATIFGISGFLLGLYTNKRGRYMYRRMTVGLMVATMVLVSYSFAYTYQRYFQIIKETCASPDNDVYCARHEMKSEVVVFSLGLGLCLFSLVFWISACSFFSKSAHDFVSKTDRFLLEPKEEEKWENPSYSNPKRNKQCSNPPVVKENYHRSTIQKTKNVNHMMGISEWEHRFQDSQSNIVGALKKNNVGYTAQNNHSKLPIK